MADDRHGLRDPTASDPRPASFPIAPAPRPRRAATPWPHARSPPTESIPQGNGARVEEATETDRMHQTTAAPPRMCHARVQSLSKNCKTAPSDQIRWERVLPAAILGIEAGASTAQLPAGGKCSVTSGAGGPHRLPAPRNPKRPRSAAPALLLRPLCFFAAIRPPRSFPARTG
jgi:hypothetical protein